ncbi:MAG: FAD-dependent oxidoreductase [Deferrisomatales bacterium]|nr:FAD-dependent oxidoreductase [Deferrisomatales bacterium]
MNGAPEDLYQKTPNSIVLYGTTWCPDCKQAKRFFGEHRVPYTNVDIEQDTRAMEFVVTLNHGKQIVPTIVFPDGTVLMEPSDAELAEKLGLQTKAKQEFYDAIVLGGGPAGLTAALYLAREGQETLVIEKAAVGGQSGVTQALDNFPGFDEGIAGAEFAERLARQTRRFGAEILEAQEVVSIIRQGGYLMVGTSSGANYCAKTALLASGARYRRLGVPGEEELLGTSIHFCATCDGAFYKGKKVLVIGGGNSGFEEGLFLTRFASEVDIVEFEPEVKASRILQDKVAEKVNMRVFTNHAVQEFTGESRLETVVVQDRETGATKEWRYDGVFVFIGLTPNSSLVAGQAELDAQGFVMTGANLMTRVPGLFAAGDVRAGSTKQAVSAAGEGAAAALMMRDYLKEVG